MSNSAGDDNNSHTSSETPAITEQTRRKRRPAAQRRAAKAIAKLTGNALPHHTYQRAIHTPRPEVRPPWGSVIAMQVWVIAATMTFYLVLSLLPGLIALSSIVALVDFTEETMWTIGELVNELIPALKASTVVHTLMSLIDTPGGLTALI